MVQVLQRRGEHSGWQLEVDNDQLRAIIKANPLTTMWEVVEELNVNHPIVIWHLKQIRKVKKLCKWVPHELTANQKKNCCFKHVFSYCTQVLLLYTRTTNHFSVRLWHSTKSGLYDNQQWPAQQTDWEEAPRHFQKPNWHQKKVMVSGGLLPVWGTTAFGIPEKPLHLRSMLSKSMRCTKTAMPAASIGQQKGPNSPQQCLTA